MRIADSFAGKYAGVNISVNVSQSNQLRFRPQGELAGPAASAGFKTGARGAHSSRTLMANDLASVLATTPGWARRADYISAVTEANCLGKPTASTRRLSAQ